MPVAGEQECEPSVTAATNLWVGCWYSISQPTN